MSSLVYYVYDIRTQMHEFVASFANRDNAESWGKEKFQHYAYVTTVPFHHVVENKKTVIDEKLEEEKDY